MIIPYNIKFSSVILFEKHCYAYIYAYMLQYTYTQHVQSNYGYTLLVNDWSACMLCSFCIFSL